MRRDPFTWPREECPVESASLVLRLKDGRKMEYTVSEPDAARLLCDYPPGRYPGDDDILYGGLPIAPDPRVLEPRPPIQFTVTFGFRLARRDEFLRVTVTPAHDAEPTAPAPGEAHGFTPPPPECPVTGWPQIDRDDLDMCSCGHRHVKIEAWGGGT